MDVLFWFQLMNKEFGGTVVKGDSREDGQEEVDVDTSCPLFK